MLTFYAFKFMDGLCAMAFRICSADCPQHAQQPVKNKCNTDGNQCKHNHVVKLFKKNPILSGPFHTMLLSEMYIFAITIIFFDESICMC